MSEVLDNFKFYNFRNKFFICSLRTSFYRKDYELGLQLNWFDIKLTYLHAANP